MLKYVLLITVLLLVLFSGCPALTTTGPKPNPTSSTTTDKNYTLVDDCEDGNDQSLQGEYYWYSYNDVSNGGDSTISPVPNSPFTMTAGGCPDSPAYAVKMTGIVTTTYQYGFIGMGIDVLFIANATGIRFYTKGDAKNYYVKVETSAVQDDGHYQYTFAASAEWQLVEILWNQFQQPEWATDVTLVTADITKISFQTSSQPLASVELAIDDIGFLK